VTEVLVPYYPSYGRIENMASPDLVSSPRPVSPIRTWQSGCGSAPLAELERTTFYDGDRRGYPDYPSWQRMA
jgi:hypothetical protein